MCDEKNYCGSCEIFYENPLGCPYSGRAEMPACDNFRPTEKVTRADMLRLASLSEFAKIFALVASCEGCPARTAECDDAEGTDFAHCAARWVARLEASPVSGNIVDMFIEK